MSRALRRARTFHLTDKRAHANPRARAAIERRARSTSAIMMRAEYFNAAGESLSHSGARRTCERETRARTHAHKTCREFVVKSLLRVIAFERPSQKATVSARQ